MGNKERGRILSIGSALLVFISALTLWLVVSTSATWGYFSNTLQELATITTGFWDDLPGQSGTSIKASKTAEGYWEMVAGEHKIGVRGEICVTNSGEQPTENLLIFDIIQSKAGGSKYQDTGSTLLVDLGDYVVLAPGISHCYPYDIDFIPVNGDKYRNVAYVTITNHSGWIPGGHNCPGPDPCDFGPAPKSGFEIPPPPDIGGDNISSPADSSPSGEFELPVPTSTASQPPAQENEPTPTEKIAFPTPTPAPTMDAALIPTLPPNEPVNPTPTLAPTAYAGPPGCTLPLDYWLSHPGKWDMDQFYLGEVEYNREQGLEILAAKPQADASYILAKQYISALLNIASPADPSAILGDLDQVSSWFQVNSLGSQPENPDRKAGLQLAENLEAYNLGETGPGSCPVEPPPATPAKTSTSQPLPTSAPTMATSVDPIFAPSPTPAATLEIPPTASTP